MSNRQCGQLRVQLKDLQLEIQFAALGTWSLEEVVLSENEGRSGWVLCSRRVSEEKGVGPGAYEGGHISRSGRYAIPPFPIRSLCHSREEYPILPSSFWQIIACRPICLCKLVFYWSDQCGTLRIVSWLAENRTPFESTIFCQHQHHFRSVFGFGMYEVVSAHWWVAILLQGVAILVSQWETRMAIPLSQKFHTVRSREG